MAGDTQAVSRGSVDPASYTRLMDEYDSDLCPVAYGKNVLAWQSEEAKKLVNDPEGGLSCNEKSAAVVSRRNIPEGTKLVVGTPTPETNFAIVISCEAISWDDPSRDGPSRRVPYHLVDFGAVPTARQVLGLPEDPELTSCDEASPRWNSEGVVVSGAALQSTSVAAASVQTSSSTAASFSSSSSASFAGPSSVSITRPVTSTYAVASSGYSVAVGRSSSSFSMAFYHLVTVERNGASQSFRYCMDRTANDQYELLDTFLNDQVRVVSHNSEDDRASGQPLVLNRGQNLPTDEDVEIDGVDLSDYTISTLETAVFSRTESGEQCIWGAVYLTENEEGPGRQHVLSLYDLSPRSDGKINTRLARFKDRGDAVYERLLDSSK
ncbi:MAG: hypothetical protein Q7S00_03940 [bacterium]|nr:hypothetical protein [bacterium]